MRVALICSAHGFGHTTRQVALAQALAEQGAAPEIWTHAPARVIHERVPDLPVVPWAPDVGIAQSDSVTEDVSRTLALCAERHSDAAVDRLAAALAGVDRVVVDVAPAALEAARRAGVPALAVGNFDWGWIYHHYPELQAEAARMDAWQAPHVGLEIAPGPGLYGFAAVERYGLLGRPADPVRLSAAERVVLVSFGGFGLRQFEALLPRIPGVRWVLSPPMPRLDRPDVIYVEHTAFPSLVAGADAVLTKPGYSILVEAALAGTPIAWIPRGFFPEARSLEAALRARGDAEVHGPDADGVGRALDELWSRPRPAPQVPDTARLAARILAG